VTLYTVASLFNDLDRYKKDLAFIFIVSSVELVWENAPADAYLSDVVKGLWITAGPARGAKCGRCWMYSETVGAVKEHPEICDRCAGNL
jgi:isoleucyl-tRNA synthetase